MRKHLSAGQGVLFLEAGHCDINRTGAQDLLKGTAVLLCGEVLKGGTRSIVLWARLLTPEDRQVGLGEWEGVCISYEIL